MTSNLVIGTVKNSHFIAKNALIIRVFSILRPVNCYIAVPGTEYCHRKPLYKHDQNQD